MLPLRKREVIARVPDAVLRFWALLRRAGTLLRWTPDQQRTVRTMLRIAENALRSIRGTPVVA
jgi:hypothetical protein